MNSVWKLPLALKSRWISQHSSVPLNARKKHASPFFIVGSGRSGTTLLRRLLVENADVYIPPESYVLGEAIRCAERVRGTGWRNLVAYVAARFEYEPEFRRFEIPTLRPFAHAMHALPENQQSLEVLIDELYRYFARENGYETQNWGDKTPYNTYFMPEIKSVFPNAKFINMQRDGCDVVVSMLKAGRYDNVETAALRWRSACECVEAFSKKSPQSVHTIKYERLIAKPDEEIASLRELLSLPENPAKAGIARPEKFGDMRDTPHLARALEKVDPNNHGKGRIELDHRQRQLLKPIMDPMLVKQGYDPLD